MYASVYRNYLLSGAGRNKHNAVTGQHNAGYWPPPNYHKIQLVNTGAYAPVSPTRRPRGNLVSFTGNTFSPSNNVRSSTTNTNPNLGGGSLNNSIRISGDIWEYYMGRYYTDVQKLGFGPDNEMYVGGQSVLQPPSTFPGGTGQDYYGEIGTPYTSSAYSSRAGYFIWENIYDQYGNRVAVRGDSALSHTQKTALHLDNYTYDGVQDGDTVDITWWYSVAWPTVTTMDMTKGKKHTIDWGESTTEVIHSIWGHGSDDQYYLAFETKETHASLNYFSNYSAIRGGRNSYEWADNGDTGSGPVLYNGVGTGDGYAFARQANGTNMLDRSGSHRGTSWNAATYIILGWNDFHRIGYTFRRLTSTPIILSCFGGNTPIKLANGTSKELKYVKVGDKIKSYDIDNNEVIDSTVTDKISHYHVDGYLLINNEIVVSYEHVMYINGAWKDAINAKPGDYFTDLNQNKVTIDTIVNIKKPIVLYDLSVEHNNFYAHDILVHNKTVVQPPTSPPLPPPTTSCFTGDTRITMSDGISKRIKDVEVGDVVLGYDTNNGEIISSRVVETFEHPNTEGYLVVNDNLNVTPEHPMYDGSEWKPVGQFGILDSLQTIHGNKKSIDKIEWCNDVVTTYNLEVESEHHNYFANDYLVHNKTIVLPPPYPPVYPPPNPPPVNPPPSCFTGNTLISLSNGKTKPIKNIRVRDKVLVYDFIKKINVESTVVKTEYHADIDEYFVINGEINVTPEHLIYTGKDWVAVRDLVLTDFIQTIDGELKPVKSIEKMFKRVCVYNFHVENEHHNYYANGYLVHNSKTVNPPTNPPGPPVGPPGGPGGGGGGGGTDPEGGITSNGVYMASTDASDVHRLRLVNTYAPTNSSACTSLIELHAKLKDSTVDFLPGTVTTVDLDIISTGILNKEEKLIGLSEFRKKISNPFTDTFNVSGYEVCKSFTTSFPLCTVPAGDHQLLQLFVKKYHKNYMLDDGKIRPGTLSSQAYDALNGKISVGNIRYDAVNKVVKSVSLSSDIVFTGFGRSLTAAWAYSDNEYRAYVPTTAWGVPLNPLYNDGTAHSVTEFIVQNGSMPNNQVNAALFELEWPHKPGQNYLPDSKDNGSQYNGGRIGDSITYYDTPNPLARLMPLTAQDLYNIYGQTSINRTLARSGTRFNLSGPTNGIYSHSDRSARRQTLFNKQSFRQIQTIEGYPFGIYTTGLSGKYYSFTTAKYPGSTVPSITSDRITTEANNVSGWDIARFEDFTTLSAVEFNDFLLDQGKVSIMSPVTSQQGVVEPLGFVTYNNSLTAADGSYYVAALTRCTVPSWVEIADEIGGTPRPSGSDPRYANYVICTSGHNLVLPYITSFDTASL